MSNNALPKNLKRLLARAEDCADGAHELEDEIPLVLIRESNLRAHLQTLKGDLTATPPVPGLIYLFKVAESERKAAESARADKDKEVNTFLVSARARLALYLGPEASAAWGPTGFLSAQGNSNAVPRSQDDRLQCLAMLGLYLSAHPAYEQAAGTPAPEVTHTRALALHAELSDARALANAKSDAQETALNARKAAEAALRTDMSALVVELSRLLSDTDPRWEEFGLNIPANPRAPEAAKNLALSGAGSGRVLAEWDPGRRSDDDRVMIQIVGVDADFREYGKSGGDGEEVIKDLPPGATLRVRIIALNGSLEAPGGPEGEIVVP